MQIGRLVKQSIRSIWTAEDREFTPWLAQQENLDLLAETLGIGSLQQIYEEVAVGS
ncbi:hypothetical protein Q4543_23560 [Salipiger sp. 1_MG-2023]|uniref:hypothetical protein n=1 Tax=Salipiger sp. 1_MG-2023 TaxID=3062665 RepID=UPI0026E2C5E9|nr:hypothetical protein [Salipiger sp. 1_MG-2023]MDO6588464.1 hypothetical protein [Salipiger sp. 1_MG-2023]